MKLLEYRFLSTDDLYDGIYGNWSRNYEYPVVLDEIKRLGCNLKMHNSAWGSDRLGGIPVERHPHVLFRNRLDKMGECVHTDLLLSDSCETVIYDITKQKPEYNNMFDVVLNVSVIEHLPIGLQLTAMNNLFNQIKDGGYFICTFDYPSVNLQTINQFIGESAECKKPTNILNGANSQFPQQKYSNLNIVYLVIKKI